MSQPIVLVFAGFDPTGGAGLQADIETINALGGHCCPLITANTIQNTQAFLRSQATDLDWLIEQTEHLLRDIQPDAIKIGLVTDPTHIIYIAEVITRFPTIPVVFDPVLRSGSGQTLTNKNLIDVMRSVLLPKVSVLTPNHYEAKTLSGKEGINEAVKTLSDCGSESIFVTGTDNASSKIEHQLFDQSGLIKSLYCEKLPGTFHGTGCTLSSAIAIKLAQGKTLFNAVEQAHHYTLETINQAEQIGKAQKHPKRFFD